MARDLVFGVLTAPKSHRWSAVGQPLGGAKHTTEIWALMKPTLLVAWRVLTERCRGGDATDVLSSALRAVLEIRDLELRTRVHIREERRNPVLPREHHAPIPARGIPVAPALSA